MSEAAGTWCGLAGVRGRGSTLLQEALLCLPARRILKWPDAGVVSLKWPYAGVVSLKLPEG